jgi:hypothetical protein
MAYIVVTLNDQEICRRELNGPLTLGRSVDCDIWLNDPGVSRRHARIEPRYGGEWGIVDLGSRNGIFIHQEQLSDHTLHDGDSLKLGPARVMFHAVGFIASRPSAPGSDDGTRPIQDRAGTTFDIPVEELFKERNEPEPRPAAKPPADSGSRRDLPTPRPITPGDGAPSPASPDQNAPAPAPNPGQKRPPPRPLPFTRPPARPIVTEKSPHQRS